MYMYLMYMRVQNYVHVYVNVCALMHCLCIYHCMHVCNHIDYLCYVCNLSIHVIQNCLKSCIPL